MQHALFHPAEQPALQQHQPAPRGVRPRPPRPRQVRTPAGVQEPGEQRGVPAQGSQERSARLNLRNRNLTGSLSSRGSAVDSNNARSRFRRQIRHGEGQTHGEKSPSTAEGYYGRNAVGLSNGSDFNLNKERHDNPVCVSFHPSKWYFPYALNGGGKSYLARMLQ